jgi:hypothetical protein
MSAVSITNFCASRRGRKAPGRRRRCKHLSTFTDLRRRDARLLRATRSGFLVLARLWRGSMAQCPDRCARSASHHRGLTCRASEAKLSQNEAKTKKKGRSTSSLHRMASVSLDPLLIRSNNQPPGKAGSHAPAPTQTASPASKFTQYSPARIPLLFSGIYSWLYCDDFVRFLGRITPKRKAKKLLTITEKLCY